MKLLINQKAYYLKVYKFKDTKSILYSAEIFTNRRGILLKITDSNNNIVSTVRQTNYKWLQGEWNMEYEMFLLQTNEIYNVRCIKYIKRHWIASSTDNKSQLDYYGHKGHKKSIFLDGKQIALVDKRYLNFFNRDTIYIDLNNDVDPLLVLTYALIFELNVDTDGATFTIDLGGFTEEKKYDEAWKPK